MPAVKMFSPRPGVKKFSVIDEKRSEAEMLRPEAEAVLPSMTPLVQENDDSNSVGRSADSVSSLAKFVRLLAIVVHENGSIEVKDDKEVTQFTATSIDKTFYSRRQVSNAKGKQLSRVEGQFFTAHSEHTVYVDGEKVFTLRHKSTSHKDTNVNIQVFLDKHVDIVVDTEVEEQEKTINALAKKKKRGALNIIGDWQKKNFKISKQGSEKIIAQVSPHDDKDKFVVEIASGVDPKLVISLIAAVDSMQSHHKSKLATRVAKGSLKAAPACAYFAGWAVGCCCWAFDKVC